MSMIRVAEVYRPHGAASTVVPEDIPLTNVVARFALKPGLRGICLVDSRQRFAGIVSRIDLMRWAHIQLFGGKGRHEITVSEFFRIADAKKARDLARRGMRSLSVKETGTLQTALDLMLDYEEDVIPVLDDEGRILGDLRLSEVLWKVLEIGKQSPP